MQNKNNDFSKSLLLYSDGEKRLLIKCIFERKHFNEQIIDRPWLINFETTGNVFCNLVGYSKKKTKIHLTSEGYMCEEH